MAKLWANDLAQMMDSLMHSRADGAAGECSRATAELGASADVVLLAESGN
jgi:hypothetical protein